MYMYITKIHQSSDMNKAKLLFFFTVYRDVGLPAIYQENFVLHCPPLRQDLRKRQRTPTDGRQRATRTEQQILINTGPNTLAKITVMTLSLTINFEVMKAINLHLKAPTDRGNGKWFFNQRFDDTCQEMANLPFPKMKRE